MINRGLANFLKEHRQLIQEGEWNKLYQILSILDGIHPYEISEILIQVNPHLPNDLQDIPGACFAGISIPGSSLTLRSKSIGWEAFSVAGLPSQVNLIDVGRVGQEAFYRSQFDNLTVVGDTYIEEGTFKGCKVVNVDLSRWNTKKLAPYLFRCCKRLAAVKLPDTLSEIGAYAFAECPNLTSIDLPNQLESIHREAFAQCLLQTITTPKTANDFLNTTQGVENLLYAYNDDTQIKCADRTLLATEMRKL